MVSISDILPPVKHESAAAAPSASLQLVRQSLSVAEVSKNDLMRQRSQLDLRRPSEEEIQETMDRTQQAFDEILKKQMNKDTPPPKETIVSYSAGDSSDNTKQLRIIEAEYDPLEPPRHRALRRSEDQVVENQADIPILRPPAPKLSAEERKQWAIPPSISHWKNDKGYVLPLEYRNIDRGQAKVVCSETSGHSALASALADAETVLKDEVDAKKTALLESKAHNEERVRLLMKKAHSHDQSKRVHEDTRDSEDVQFDSRLYHRSKRQRDTYEQPLFATEQAKRTIYRPNPIGSSGDSEQTSTRTKPIEFEKDES